MLKIKDNVDLKELENKNAKLYILNKGEVNEFVYKLDNCAYKFLLEKKGPENYNIVCNKLNKDFKNDPHQKKSFFKKKKKE